MNSLDLFCCTTLRYYLVESSSKKSAAIPEKEKKDTKATKKVKRATGLAKLRGDLRRRGAQQPDDDDEHPNQETNDAHMGICWHLPALFLLISFSR